MKRLELEIGAERTQVTIGPSIIRLGSIYLEVGCEDLLLTPEEALQVAEALNEAAEEVRDEDW